MKSKNILATTIALVIALTSCKKTNTDCSLIPAKIIRYDCDRVIFQLQSPTLIGDATWTDVQTGLQYSNVVSYYNTCKIVGISNGKKITLYVSIKEPDTNPSIPDCFRCEALSQNPPQTKVEFTEISLSGCENAQN
jgi:hypothetical protein